MLAPPTNTCKIDFDVYKVSDPHQPRKIKQLLEMQSNSLSLNKYYF